MTKILFAWELGANYGHLMSDLPLAKCLRARGHDVWFAVCDIHVAQALLGPHDFPFAACPTLARSPQQSRPPVNFSDILAAQGYGDIQTLSALVNAWIALLRAIKPQVVVADHAPTALLAARILSLPTVPIGAPFTIPPLLDPLPSIRPWESISQAALLQADRRVLTTINEVLGNHRRPLLERIADLFAGSVPQLTTVVELDFGAPRAAASYLGPITSPETQARVAWNGVSDKKRVFAYLRPTVPGLESMFNALRTLPIDLICVIPGASGSMIERLRGEGICARNTPVDLAALLPDCDLVIGYGGLGGIAQALLHGVPLLLMPHALEHQLNTRQAALLGAAIDLETRRTVDRCSWALTELLFNPSYGNNARALRDKYSAFDNQSAVEDAAGVILSACG